MRHSLNASVAKVVQRLGDLVAIPSVSSTSAQFDQSNRAMIERLQSELDALGFCTQVQDIDNTTGKPKQNLIAHIGPFDDPSRRGLLLSGHTDTVPCNPELWHSDPFTLTERDDRLYGLGSTDMKGFIAIAIEAAQAFAGQRLEHSLSLLMTADEESSMSGARHLADQGEALARHAIIGEPTGLQPIRSHKGILMEALRITGRSGHSSDPALGNNALEGMHEALEVILAWRSELQARASNRDFAMPTASLNPGRIEGGDNPNRICAQCELQFDLRFLPGMEAAQLRDELHQRVAQRLHGSGLQIEWRPLFGGIPAFETAADSELIAFLEDLTGKPAGCVAFGTEGPFFNQLGMQTVIMGPGDIAVAHQPDEFLPLDSIQPTLDILDQTIRHYCL